MYVAVKGGEKAIDHAHGLLAQLRRGAPDVPALGVRQIQEQMPFAVARVMTEGSLYDPQLAALAIKQAGGDMLEAIFLLRAYRTTLPRFLASEPVDTTAMQIERRISATYKDLPGGQVLGPTFDYTHRLLDFSLLDEDEGVQDAARPTLPAQGADATSAPGGMAVQQPPMPQAQQGGSVPEQTALGDDACLRVLGWLEQEGLMRAEQDAPGPVPDITREPLDFPSNRQQRLQMLARGDEGFLMALAYSTQRGYGRNHPFAGEIRIGQVELWIAPQELGFDICVGDIQLTECEMVNQFMGSATEPVQFTRGYGLAFGHNERKAMGMALVDRALCAPELGEDILSPAQQEEFVLMHSDNVEAAGFVAHLKLPHYVDFQSELDLVRRIRTQGAPGHDSIQEPTA